MKKTTLSIENLIKLDNDFIIHKTDINVEKIIKNINDFSLELNITSKKNYIGNAYNKAELLNFCYHFGKKIFKILKSTLKHNIFDEYIYDTCIFEIDKITIIQKEKILDLYENLFYKYDLIINNYNFYNKKTITIPFFNLKNNNNLLKISEKFIIIFLIFDLYKRINYLFTNLNSDEYGVNDFDINKNLKKIKYICDLFLGNNYFINLKDTNKYLLSIFQLFHVFSTNVFNVLSENISINTFSTYTTQSSTVLLFSSHELLDLAIYILIDTSIALVNNNSPFATLNQTSTCPLCNKVFVKAGKTDIICSNCRQTSYGKKFIKNRHLEKKSKMQFQILSDFEKIRNPSPQLLDIIQKIKIKITDHQPTISDLTLARQEINKALNL